jgi:Na+/H+ antiporter NhaD/arsenite permease-like protein
MIPLVDQLIGSGLPPEPLIWSLALGADLGGNLTIVGASANVVVANLAGRAGHPITFFTFFKYGSIIVVQSLIISSVYVWLRYLS